MDDKNMCPKCGKGLKYFQTKKKWYCKDHGFVEPLDKEVYDRIVKGLREQFGLEGASD